LLPAMNSTIDTSNTRTWAALTHPPVIIYGLLFVIALICAFIAGNSLADARSNVGASHLEFCPAYEPEHFVTLEIEYPRIAFINIEKYDQALIDVRQSMH